MGKSTDQQFQEADAAIKRAVAALMGAIDQMMVRWDVVAPTHIIEGVLLKLSEGLTELIDDPRLANHLGPATLKLSNALVDYRDSQIMGRG
jgi:hypothetical protein